MVIDRSPPMFIADTKSLDFLNSVATPVDTPVEWIADGEDLLVWVEAAGMIDPSDAKALRRRTNRAELDAVAVKARTLREWFRGFVVNNMGRPLKGSALEQLKPLNRALQLDESFGQVVVRHSDEDDGSPSGLAWQTRRRWRSPEELLLPVAQAMGELICDEDFSLVKACEGQACTLVFLDRTRGHARRWCSMAVCGNRAKQAAHRKRMQEM
jgi:predicted RNA-binding Zn ribbon-like protein